jgi:hypothetical protein
MGGLGRTSAGPGGPAESHRISCGGLFEFDDRLGQTVADGIPAPTGNLMAVDAGRPLEEFLPFRNRVTRRRRLALRLNPPVKILS